MLFAWFLIRKKPYLLILLYGFISIFFYYHTDFKTNTSSIDTSITESTFVWTSTYSISGQSIRGFATTPNGDKWYLIYKFSSEQEKEFFQMQSLAGSSFYFTGEMITPRMPAHEFDFDMSTYIKSHEAVGMFSVSTWKQTEQSKGIIGFLAERRYQMERHIELTFPESLVAEAKALLIGLRDDVTYEEERAYQKLGITHLFAISGLHIVFLSFLLFQTLIRLHVRKQSVVLLLILLLPVYACITGGAPSVWRAVSVSEIVLLFAWMKKRVAVDQAFAMSILLYIFYQPSVLLQVGFQLSYGAAAALIYSSRILVQTNSALRQSFVITFLCQIGVYPILLTHFYEVSISSLVMNLIFVPLFSFIILPINLIFLFLTAVAPSLANVFFAFYEPLREVLTEIILFFSSIPYQLWNPGKPSLILLIISYIGVFVTFIILEQKKNLKHIILTLGFPICLIHSTPYFDSSLEVSFLNVGQGDAIIIEYPYKRGVVLIDAGGLLRFNQIEWKKTPRSFEIGREIVVPFLKGKGITQIDTFVWTHADSDHIEGAEEILEEVKVKEIHVTPGVFKESTLNQAIHLAKLKHVPIKEQIIGRKWSAGKTKLQYLSPTDTLYEGNNDSLVLFLEHEGFRALFTGDLEENGEKRIVETYKDSLKPISVLKAGHHGSKTSSSEEFINALHPMITVFSAGVDNRYGHPHKEIVKRFHDLQLETISTAEVGTINIRVKNGLMTIRTSSEK
ncbi:MAG: DNA internalization-related competence protein ComEC/Rec2 [Paenisporosarcina sp.]